MAENEIPMTGPVRFYMVFEAADFTFCKSKEDFLEIIEREIEGGKEGMLKNAEEAWNKRNGK